MIIYDYLDFGKVNADKIAIFSIMLTSIQSRKDLSKCCQPTDPRSTLSPSNEQLRWQATTFRSVGWPPTCQKRRCFQAIHPTHNNKPFGCNRFMQSSNDIILLSRSYFQTRQNTYQMCAQWTDHTQKKTSTSKHYPVPVIHWIDEKYNTMTHTYKFQFFFQWRR